MKKITTTITRQDSGTQWFTQHGEPKSQNLIDFEAFMQTAAENLNVGVINNNSVRSTFSISDENYTQWTQYNSLIESERQAYNSANGITVETTVEDIP